MASSNCVRAVIDQPSRQLPLPLGYAGDIFFAPMHENQNERRLPPRVSDRSRDAIAIGVALVARVIKRDHRGLSAVPYLENKRCLTRADNGNVVRLETGVRVQERIVYYLEVLI